MGRIVMKMVSVPLDIVGRPLEACDYAARQLRLGFVDVFDRAQALVDGMSSRARSVFRWGHGLQANTMLYWQYARTSTVVTTRDATELASTAPDCAAQAGAGALDTVPGVPDIQCTSARRVSSHIIVQGKTEQHLNCPICFERFGENAQILCIH